MLPTWKTLFLRNLLLIAAFEIIDLPKAGCAMFDLGYFSDAKLRMTFNIYDCDGDGFLSRKDYVGMIEKFAEKENFDPSQKEAARKSFSDLFSFYISAAGGKDVPLTVNLLIESMKMQKDNPEFKKNVEAAMLSLITPMKLQEAGYLNYDEFNRAFENFDFFNVFFTKGAFGVMDANRDGKRDSERERERQRQTQTQTQTQTQRLRAESTFALCRNVTAYSVRDKKRHTVFRREV